MATQDRAGNAYGSPAKSATNAQRGNSWQQGNQLGGRDSAGGGTVARFSANTRKATPLSSSEYNDSIKAGKTPNAARGSQTSYRVSNAAGAAAGTTMGQMRSDYKQARKSGLSADDARGQAISKAGSNAKMNKDYQGQDVR